jgi:hypothetical protein
MLCYSTLHHTTPHQNIFPLNSKILSELEMFKVMIDLRSSQVSAYNGTSGSNRHGTYIARQGPWTIQLHVDVRPSVQQPAEAHWVLRRRSSALFWPIHPQMAVSSRTYNRMSSVRGRIDPGTHIAARSIGFDEEYNDLVGNGNPTLLAPRILHQPATLLRAAAKQRQWRRLRTLVPVSVNCKLLSCITPHSDTSEYNWRTPLCRSSSHNAIRSDSSVTLTWALASTAATLCLCLSSMRFLSNLVSMETT